MPFFLASIGSAVNIRILIGYFTIMPRKACIDAPGALHHIIVRGIERRKINLDDIDKTNFLERLGKILTETETRCFAWALMSNHFLCEASHKKMKRQEAPMRKRKMREPGVKRIHRQAPPMIRRSLKGTKAVMLSRMMTAASVACRKKKRKATTASQKGNQPLPIRA